MSRDPLPLLPIAFGLVAAGAVLALTMGAPIAAVLATGVAGIAGIWLASNRAPPQVPPLPPAPPPLPPLQDHPAFAALFDALGQPLLLVEGERVRAANHAARALLGDFIVGADVRAAIRHPAAADLIATNGAPAAATDLVGIGAAGQRWEMRAAPLGDAGQIVILTDRTERDAVERMRADFVANASHELRTPLAAIIGFIETLSDPDTGRNDALRNRFLGVMDTEARRMLRLIEDLLSISRIEAAKGLAPDGIVDLAALLQQAVGELRAGADPRAADIVVEIDGPATVRGERAQLSQMLHNILGNAMKYGRAATPIVARLQSADGGMALLSVSDRGDGIPQEHIPRLTERFYRVDSARSRALGGTGLGLAIVKHVVERHRGRLEIRSVEDEGTSLLVRLPLAPADAQG